MNIVTGRKFGDNIFKIGFRIGVFLLDTIAPSDPLVRRIENMSVVDFMNITAKAASTQSTHGGSQAILSYHDPLVKTALLEIKLYGNTRLAVLLGSVLYTHLCARLLRNTYLPLLIIPIPITQKSLRARGWNQCELIAEGLKKADRQKMIATQDKVATFEIRTDILYKIRETSDQVGKGRQARFENLKNSFEVLNPSTVNGRDVIVFDDILTTGATLGEAARAIQSAGARHVTCIALAH